MCRKAKQGKYYQAVTAFIDNFLCCFGEVALKELSHLKFERRSANGGGLGSAKCLVGRCGEEVTCQVSDSDIKVFDYRAHTLSRSPLSFKAENELCHPENF